MGYRLGSCCGCYPLRFGTIFTGIATIILSILGIIMLYTLRVEYKAIIIEIDEEIAKLIFALNLVMTIIITTLMMIGAIRKNTMLMLPWVILGVLLLITMLVSVLYTSIMFFLQTGALHNVLYGIIFLICGLITVVVYTYFWFVVYSYFQEIEIEKFNSRPDPYGRNYNYQRP